MELKSAGTEWKESIKNTEEELRERSAELEAVRSVLRERSAELEAVRSVLRERSAELEAVRSVLRERCAELEEVQKELRECRAEIEVWKRLSLEDEMTGLYNRRFCIETLRELLRKDRPFSICFVDADGLKLVNDRYGHMQGDRYLCCIAECLKKQIQAPGTVCRLYGDEFAVLLPEVTVQAAKEVLSRTEKEMRETYSRLPLPVGISYGIYERKAGEMLTGQELLNQAELRMYEHKRSKPSAKTDV